MRMRSVQSQKNKRIWGLRVEIVSADSGAFEHYVKLGIDPVTTKSDKFMMAF